MGKFLLKLLKYLLKFIDDLPIIGAARKFAEKNLEITLLVVFIILLILIPFMWYFLYKLKPIGKKLFIFYLIMGAISYLVISDNSYIITSVTPFTPFLEFSENALILLDGVILAFLFFTEVKGKFK